MCKVFQVTLYRLYQPHGMTPYRQPSKFGSQCIHARPLKGSFIFASMIQACNDTADKNFQKGTGLGQSWKTSGTAIWIVPRPNIGHLASYALSERVKLNSRIM